MSEGQEIAERQDPEVVAIVAPARASGPPPAAIIFIAALIVVTLTLGSSIALLTRSGPLAVVDEDELVRSPAPTRTGAAAPTPVRVAAASGNSARLEAGTYRITFLWTLDGAREGDSMLVRFSAGSRALTEQRGRLDPNLFTASTGRLTFATTQECSAEGWSAELVTIRGVAATGETTSRVPGVTCP
jgi:hypothetical protein